MTGPTPPWGWVLLAVCAIAALLAGMWIGYERGFGHGEENAAEEASWKEQDARWKRDEAALARPAPVRPAPPPRAPRAGPGKHRHPGGPPQHAALPVAGYLPAPDGPWDGTITVNAPAQAPPWAGPDAPAYRPDQLLRARPGGPDPTGPMTDWEPVLEPTAVLSAPPPDPCTDSQFTRRMALDMDQWIREHITATDSVLKQITQ